MPHEWYRQERWTPATREAFFTRLQKARDKSQYLRVQAVTLEAAGEYEAALELVDYYFENHSDKLWNSTMYACRASAHLALGSPLAAVSALRLALDAERAVPQVRTDAWLDFAELVALNSMADIYDEALSVLNEFSNTSGRLAFPVERFRFYGSKALISHGQARTAEAVDLAHLALEEADKVHSGISRHPVIGLVGSRQARLLGAVRQLTVA